MKKKFVATLCSVALALTLPLAAFAADDEVAVLDSGTSGAPAPGDIDLGDLAFDSTYDVKTDTTTVEVPEGWFSAEYEDKDIDDPLKKITVEGAKDVQVIPGRAEFGDEYSDEAIQAYDEWLDEVIADGGTPLFTVTINGEVTAEDHAVVTFFLSPDEYGNKVVTYYVMHKGDAQPQKKVVRVHSDGTVRIWMDSFSIITFVDVDGITKYENMVEPQDGDLLSPKTGC